MAHQSPMMSIPKKTTEEVDWTNPIRNLISQSYGENPDNYAAEYSSLQRCRQDAVRGAGSDLTARDLLYKYFGQLELLELRFSEIRVNFSWHDAFTNKLTTQTSIAYEKASILFQIAVTHSAIAASQNRSDPEGLKRSFYYFRTCAGMLTYINENFLHAPSTDLSREVIKFLVSVIMAQATEVFFEKCTDEKKGNALVSKIGAQAASMYASLVEEMKEFMGKGIFDRNWVVLIQTKAKYFMSLSHYYRALADNAAGKYGDALVRFILAESLAKEASRTASTFASAFVPNMSPNLPADAGPSMQDRMKAHLAICTDRKNEAQRENDLIYNAVLPTPEALPPIDKTVVATAIPIQEVFGTPDVQKVIGQDIFIRLIPLSVHESASVYSEEKATLVRGEVEKAEGADGEVRSALDAMGVKEGLSRFRAMAEGEVGGQEEVPIEVRRWKDDIELVEEREGVEVIVARLNKLKEGVKRELHGISRDLEIESKDCEVMRVKYEHMWTQPPSAGLSKSLRQDLKSHFGALEAAETSDQQVSMLWDSVKGDIRLLLSHEVENIFRASTERGGGTAGQHLLDLDVGSEADDAEERKKIGHYVKEIEERLGRLNKIGRERNEVLKDLKEKIQTDDVSHLLLLNRRNTGIEPTLFAAELEKFRPYQQRLSSTVHHQQLTIQELATLWKVLKDLAGRGPGVRRWDEREKKKKDTVRRFSRARDGYMEVRDGLAKGLQFYNELTELTATLRRNVKAFVSGRTNERDALIAQIETEKRLSASAAPPPLAAKPPLPPPPTSPPSLDASFTSLSLRGGPTSPPPPSQWQTGQQQPYPNPPTQYNPPGSSSQYSSPPGQQQNSFSRYSSSPGQQQPQQVSRAPYLPPPPPQPTSSYPSAPAADPYANLSLFNPASYSQNQSHVAAPASASPPHQQPYVPQPPQHTSQSSYPPHPPLPSHQQQPSHQYQQQQSNSSPFGALPPPPTSYQQGSPPPLQQQDSYQMFQSPPQQGYGQGQHSQAYGR